MTTKLRVTPMTWDRLISSDKLTTDTREWLFSCAGVNESVVVLMLDPTHALAVKTAAQMAEMKFGGRTAGAIERIRQALHPEESVKMLASESTESTEEMEMEDDEAGSADEQTETETERPTTAAAVTPAPAPVVAVNSDDRETEIAAFVAASQRVSIRDQFRQFALDLMNEEKGK